MRPFHPDKPGATDVLDCSDGRQADGYGPADDPGSAEAQPPGPGREVNRAATSGFRHPALMAFGRALGIGGDYGPEGSIWQILAYSRFRWYFSGSVVSNLGTWLQNVAQVVLAYQLTRHSVFAVGMVSCAQFSSPLLLGPWAGKLTNRIGNWRVLIVTQCLSVAIAAALAALELIHALTVPLLYTGATLVGLAFTFALPPSQ